MTGNHELVSYPFDKANRLDVHPMYARLRTRPGLLRVQLPYGTPAWLATRYEDVKQLVGDPRFSREQAVGEDEPRIQPFSHRADSMTMMDPPGHTRLRRVVTRAFAVRRIERLRPRTQAIVDGLIDEMRVKGPVIDLMEDVADVLPMTVVCELLGIPIEERARFREWTEIIGSAEPAESKMRNLNRANAELRDYLGVLLDLRRAEPAEDLLSVLAQAHDDGERLSREEMVGLAWAVLLAGYEITTCQIGNFAYTLLTRPEQTAQLRADPDLIVSAVEEMLRHVPLTTGAFFARRATEDVELGGTLVRAGEAVLPSMMSANRDESVFEDPDRLDFTRRENNHLSFSYGIHHCLGAQLARMELQVVLGSLLAAFPDLRLATPVQDVPWRAHGILRGPRELPVTW